MLDPVEKQWDSGPKFQPEWVDAVIADLAGRQHGTVARWQMIRLGIGEDAIKYRIQRKRLHAIHQGVYAVGHSSLSRHGRWMAATLAGGPGAALSHRDGAALHGLVQSSHRDIDVTVPVKGRRRRGIRFHYADLPADERTVVHGIRVTTVPRTIFDLASIWRRDRVELALHEAEVQRLHDRLALRDLLSATRERAGSGSSERSSPSATGR